MRVSCIDARVGAVRIVAENLVNDADGSVVAGYTPYVRFGPGVCQSLAFAVVCLELEDIFREFRHRVATRRRSAHANIERLRAQVGERDFYLHPVVLRFGKGDFINNRRLSLNLRPDGGSRCNDECDRQQNATHGSLVTARGSVLQARPREPAGVLHETRKLKWPSPVRSCWDTVHVPVLTAGGWVAQPSASSPCWHPPFLTSLNDCN